MSKVKTALATAATVLTMAAGVQEASAQIVQPTPDPSKDTTEMTSKKLMVGLQQSSTDVQSDSLTDWNSAKQSYEETKGEGGLNIEPDPEGGQDGNGEAVQESGKLKSSFRFKPISVDLGGSSIKNGAEWAKGITTKIEFAGGSEHTSLYGYAREDWNKYAKGFNEGLELFANENLHLGKNFDLNSKQFYWGKGAGRILVGPQVSVNKKMGKVGLGASLGVHAQYDILPGQKNKLSGSGTLSYNLSFEQQPGNPRVINGFVNANLDGSLYGEDEVETPNFLDPKKAGKMCGWLFARFGGNVKEINLNGADGQGISGLGVGIGFKYKFK